MPGKIQVGIRFCWPAVYSKRASVRERYNRYISKRASWSQRECLINKCWMNVMLIWDLFPFSSVIILRIPISSVRRHRYRKLDVQLPRRPVLKIVLDHSIICAWQVSQAQWLRFITTDILLYITYYDARLHFYGFPKLWPRKTFPILS